MVTLGLGPARVGHGERLEDGLNSGDGAGALDLEDLISSSGDEEMASAEPGRGLANESGNSESGESHI